MRAWIAVAALNGFIAMAAGAFAAHALRSRLDAHALQIFETGARYQMYHALAMGLATFAMREQAMAPAEIAAALFLAGIVLFSGSLYLLALTGTRAFAVVTPFGGVAFLLGWLSLAWAGLRLTR
ncbi:MAG TPA: DUF423 domain-containing protein [Rhizomicrobium sp.]|jgi:uncharacterized membrane protein YgdD (TMEM256/DUF423 family)|nr:DUF423 domain-containing protein [Rhizomicrobium sp.]